VVAVRGTQRPNRARRRAALVVCGAMAFAACVVSEEFDDAQFLCDPQGGADECPGSMTCGGDGVCRHSTAKPDGSAGTGGADGSNDGNCFPVACATLAPKCGELDDGCGNKIQCGCSAPYTCGGGAKQDECGCTREQSQKRSPDAAFEQKVTGNADWQSVSSVLASDDKWATTAANLSVGQVTNLLKASAFNFTLPKDAAVKGVEVSIERSAATSASSLKDKEVRVLVGGNPLATVANKNIAWATSDGEASYGSATDLWGATSISKAQVEAADFGVSLTVTATAADTPRVDAISMTVHFEDPSCPASN